MHKQTTPLNIHPHAIPDRVLPTDCPPGNLPTTEVPQFIVLAYDDNNNVEAMQWMIDLLKDKFNPPGTGQSSTFDGSPIRTTFFSAGKFLDGSPEIQKAHRDAFEQGHEIANHSYNHPDGSDYTVEQWVDEISQCQRAFERAGIPAEAVRGFRIPYASGGASVYEALAKLGFTYDASIEEGGQLWTSGLNFMWPYTLDEGSPGQEALAYYGFKKSIGKHPGLWQIHNGYFFVPPDYACERYDCRRGLRDRVKESTLQHSGWDWETEPGKLTAFDYNVWRVAGLQPEEVLATWKYTLDLRLAGNRAPLLFDAHVEYIPETELSKRAVIEAFISYALQHSAVRIVPAIRIIDWMRNPQPLASNSISGS